MKGNKLLLSEFANEEGFELQQYLTQLFDLIKLPTSQTQDTEPASS